MIGLTVKSYDQLTLFSEIYIGGGPIYIAQEREREKRERTKLMILETTISGSIHIHPCFIGKEKLQFLN